MYRGRGRPCGSENKTTGDAAAAPCGRTWRRRACLLLVRRPQPHGTDRDCWCAHAPRTCVVVGRGVRGRGLSRPYRRAAEWSQPRPRIDRAAPDLWNRNSRPFTEQVPSKPNRASNSFQKHLHFQDAMQSMASQKFVVRHLKPNHACRAQSSEIPAKVGDSLTSRSSMHLKGNFFCIIPHRFPQRDNIK